MRKFFISLIILLPIIVAGQNMPAFRQFYFNPFLFNPAYTGAEGYTEISLVHRQQWLNINDAPVASGFTLQHPTNTRAAFGFSFLTQEAVALRNTSAKATFAYRIPISSKQMFFFGLSTGAGFNHLDLDGIDYSNDPTILNAADNAFYVDGNFGALYVLGGLKVGFALPRLFGQTYFSPQQLEGHRFSQLKNQLYSVSYKIRFAGNGISLEPYFLYRQNRDNQNSWEVASILYFKDKIWAGASYNNTQGVAFFLGMLIKEKLRLGYSYELPPVNDDFISTSSHEIHINLRLGKKKIFKWANKTQVKPAENIILPDSSITNDSSTVIAREEETPKEVPSDGKVIPAPAEKVAEIESTTQPMNVGQSRPPIRDILVKGYYIIVGAFQVRQNALRLQESVKKEGVESVYVGLNAKKGLYYVYVFSTYDLEEAREALKIYAIRRYFSDAWLVNIEE